MNNNYYTPNINTTQNNEEIYRRDMYFYEKKKLEKKEIRKLGNILGCTIVLYIILQLASVSVIQALGLSDLFLTSSTFSSAFTIIGVEIISVLLPFLAVGLINKKKIQGDIIPAKKMPVSYVLLWSGFGMLVCVLANYCVGIMVAVFKQFGYELTQSDTPEPNSIFACVLLAVSTAVMPAICEEIAMRCVSLGMLKKYGKGFAVFAVSIIFGLLHGNVIQFVFAFLCALAFGYITVKTDNVVPAMLAHGFNNGMSVLTMISTYAFGKDAEQKVVVALYLFWFAVGVICTLTLLIKKQFKSEPNEQAYEPYKNSLGSKLASFFFVPGMIFPFIFLIISTITSIQKI